MDLADEINIKLQNDLNPGHLEIYNDSHKHAGHREAGDAINTHFRIEISKDFIDGSRIDKHRAIMRSISKYMNNPIHAVEIKLI